LQALSSPAATVVVLLGPPEVEDCTNLRKNEKYSKFTASVPEYFGLQQHHRENLKSSIK
jgi:hypothetical protein